MLKQKEIMDAVEDLVQERFPTMKAYRNLVRKNFDRPSFLVACRKPSMEDATARTVDRTVQVAVTLFVQVDDYHDSQMNELADLMDNAMELFSCGAIGVKDRYLDVGSVTGEVGYDYAELVVPLSWQDDRELHEQEYQPIKEVDLAIEVNR